MARRTSTTATEPTTDPTDETTEPTAPVTEDAAPATPEAPEVPIDLGPFQTAAEAAIAEMDEATGELPKIATDAVNKVYREIDGIKGKNAARSWVDDQMKASVKDKNIARARAFVAVKEGLSAGAAAGAAKAPADPTTAFVNKVAALVIADALVRNSVPEGVEDWEAKVEALVTELSDQVDTYQKFADTEDADAEQPEVSPVVRQAFKLSLGKGGGGGTRVLGGPRRDIEKHLIQVFESEEVGSFLTVNEIAKAASTEYGDDRPSAGAVSARLFPKGGRAPYSNNGISATNEEGKVKGATKVAV